MILSYQHYSDAQSWPLKHFTPREVADSQTGQIRLDLDFGRRMDLLRRNYGAPIVVTSWYRTPERDAWIGGSGNHPTGAAADIRPQDPNPEKRHRLMLAVCDMGFLGIGASRSFVHVDDNTALTKEGKRPAFWTYA